jgi:hypothetical protein
VKTGDDDWPMRPRWVLLPLAMGAASIWPGAMSISLPVDRRPLAGSGAQTRPGDVDFGSRREEHGTRNHPRPDRGGWPRLVRQDLIVPIQVLVGLSLLALAIAEVPGREVPDHTLPHAACVSGAGCGEGSESRLPGVDTRIGCRAPDPCDRLLKENANAPF